MVNEIKESIKAKLRRWLFSAEELEYEAKKLALKQMQESVNVVALARKQLAGFDPRSINEKSVRKPGDLSLLDNLSEEDELTLINHGHALYHNPALQIIVDFLIRSQVLYGQMEADSLNGLNFSRATVNGILLMKDQINNLEGFWKTRNAQPEDFDESEVV